MNYVYDIFINFSRSLYDFYEWEKTDSIIHLKKIPLYRVDKETIIDILNNRIKVSVEFLNQILNKTEIFDKNHIKYSVILASLETAIVLKFDDNGVVTNYSKLLIEEENDVLEYTRFLSITDLKYEIISKNEFNFKTREENQIKKFLNKEINSLIKEKEFEKLEYLYLESFNKKKSISDIINSINNEINENWDNVYKSLYNLLKLTTIR